ncbi:hypothetical protein PsYK624_058780 [Phanerochaete sordida]|uniref:Uncharacterized protein n=1 Tax=Phanerochaete sordida TaxID=48140 RepID=A0A9P3LBS1_9APHY|nr:hypothetical protein PsYK624_058780 [Phanerochaete sordida]
MPFVAFASPLRCLSAAVRAESTLDEGRVCPTSRPAKSLLRSSTARNHFSGPLQAFRHLSGPTHLPRSASCEASECP